MRKEFGWWLTRWNALMLPILIISFIVMNGSYNQTYDASLAVCTSICGDLDMGVYQIRLTDGTPLCVCSSSDGRYSSLLYTNCSSWQAPPEYYDLLKDRMSKVEE